MQFIDFIFPHFQPIEWNQGLTLCRGGAVGQVQIYKELVAAKVRQPLGKALDVRIKFQGEGKFIQWMECTCALNRKSGEKCAHIGALCLYLDQNHQGYLESLKFETGASEDHFDNISLQFDPEKAKNAKPKSNSKSDEFDSKSLLRSSSHSDLIKLEDVQEIDLDSTPPWLNVKVQNKAKGSWVFRLGLDDGFDLASRPEYRKKLSKKLIEFIYHPLQAKRILSLFLDENSNVYIKKSFKIIDTDNDHSKLINTQEISPGHIGQNCLFFANVGFVPFCDKLSPEAASQWNDYPIHARIEADSVVKLIETNFVSLRDICEVEIDERLKESRIVNKLNVESFNIDRSKDRFLVEDISFENFSENEKFAGITLLDILKNRSSERKYIQKNNVFYRISDEYDWLKNYIDEKGNLTLSAPEFVKFYGHMASNSNFKSSDNVILKLKQGLVSRENLEIPDISKSKLCLRPYQTDGLKWLWWLYGNALGGLLADEMGLGKTHQAMALLSAINQKKKDACFLVVCPTTVIDHWIDKLERFSPDLHVQSYHGLKRKPLMQKREKSGLVVITSYGILLRDNDFLSSQPWDVCILDEAHLIKNGRTRTYKAAHKIKSTMRLCLTGTPLENDLIELKNLFDYIVPGYLGSDKDFKRKYIVDETSAQKDHLSNLTLQKLIYPFKMRRNKVDVLHDLPEKVEDIRYCHLNKMQYELYKETLKLRGSPLIESLNEGASFSYIHVFSLITALKQICNEPVLLHPKFERYGSNKLLLLEEIISECLESNQKVVVFSQYARMVDIISKRLRSKEIEHVTLTGQSTHRGNIVKNFQENDNIKVFVGSLLAGGSGIDLTSANVVIHFDRWWNSAKEEQATDRIYRIGQTKNVQVYKFITKGTLEERIDAIISRKKYLFDKYINQDEQILKNLTREEILDILKEPDHVYVENTDL